MNILKIALLQIKPCGSTDANLKKGIECCKRARSMGADIALFPEMWSNGYNIYDRPLCEWTAEAVPADGKFVNTFGKLAGELGMAIGITILEKFPGAPRNTLVLFDRHGKRRLVYAKVHTCDFGEERELMPGEDFYAAELDTDKGPVKVGAMICYDREFPESARILMLKGAELILVPNACPMEINRLSQLRGRAYENMLAIATCNYPGGVPDCNGGSSVFDGAAYLPDMEGSRDTCVFMADENEGVYIAELDLDMLRDYRRSEVHGNAYRRPWKYGMLTDMTKSEPFIREDAPKPRGESEKLLALEKDLFRAEKITDRDWLDNVLRDDFKELGKSGVMFNKKDTIDSLSEMKQGRDIKIYNFECTELKNGCSLVHYVTRETGGKLFYRTSVWLSGQLVFHQASELREDVPLKEAADKTDGAYQNSNEV